MYQSSEDAFPQSVRPDGCIPDPAVIDEGDEPFDWNVLVPRVIHPTKVWVMEAIACIGEPLSSTQLKNLLGSEGVALSNFSHHVKTLVKAKVLIAVSQRRVRGTKETFYYFVNS